MGVIGSIFRAINLQGWLGLAGAVALGIMLIGQKAETRHWKTQSAAFEQRWDASVKAHAETVRNYRIAAEEARKADAANKARVEAEQEAINERIERDYEARLADARARAERLRQQLEARPHSGGPGAAPVPGSYGTPGGPDGPAPEAGLSITERLIATEQALQLDELQQWVRDQLRVDRTGADSSLKSLSENR